VGFGESASGSITKIIDNIINDVVDGVVVIDEKNNNNHKELIKTFFVEYFQISYVITDDFSLKSLTNILDVAELHREFSTSPDDHKVLRDQEGKKVNPLMYLQRKFHQSFLKEDASGVDGENKFPSVLEVALSKNIDYDFSDEDKNNHIEQEALKGVKNHKKYMALIQGDGDKIGKILEKMDNDPEKIKLFSEKLLEFTQQIPSIAKKYNATVVYAGGDDILAFSPILTNENSTVFDFLEELDNVFKTTIKDLDSAEAKDVSLSFGVSLTYYKKPLYQALDKALNNLFYVAKSDNLKRNRVVLELIKHSGQTYMVDIILGEDKCKNFNSLLKQELNVDESALPHAVVHNISKSLHLLKSLADIYTGDDLKMMLKNFFENNFNKEIHKNSNTQKALEYCEDLLFIFLLEYQWEKEQNTNKDDDLFKNKYRDFSALLSTIKHLRGDRK